MSVFFFVIQEELPNVPEEDWLFPPKMEFLVNANND